MIHMAVVIKHIPIVDVSQDAQWLWRNMENDVPKSLCLLLNSLSCDLPINLVASVPDACCETGYKKEGNLFCGKAQSLCFSPMGGTYGGHVLPGTPLLTLR